MGSEEVAAKRLAAWRKRIGSRALSDEDLAARVDAYVSEPSPAVWVQLRLPFERAVWFAGRWYTFVDGCPEIVEPQPALCGCRPLEVSRDAAAVGLG